MQSNLTLTAAQIESLKTLKRKFGVLANLSNPESLLQMGAANNPIVQQFFQIRNQYANMSYDDITATILSNNGYNVEGVRQQLKNEGII